jgi:hypothetical protein
MRPHCELGNKVIVKDALRAAAESQTRPALAIQELHGATDLLNAQDGNQTFGESAAADFFVDESFLAVPALEVVVRRAGLPGDALRVRDQFVGLGLEEGNEVLRRS